MFHRCWMVVATVAAMAVAVACDDRSGESASRDRTAPPADSQPADAVMASAQTASAELAGSSSAGTQPAAAYFLIDGRAAQFPPARLRLTVADDGTRALLFSDDPPKAVAAEYRGNSFYFDVPLRITDPKDLAGAEYWYKARSSAAEDDSPNGIFLDGMAVHLQPQDVVITFDGDAPRAMAKLAGRFLVVRSAGGSTPGEFASVTGTLFASVEVKRE